MKTSRKPISIILAVMLVISMIPFALVTADAAQYNASSYSELVSAVNNGASGSSIHLTDDIVLPHSKSGEYSDITVPNKIINLYLDGHKLDLGAYTMTAMGTLNLFNDSSDVGELASDNDTLTIKGATAALQTSSGVKVTSRNGNAVVSRLTKKRDIKLEGVEINAPNGSAVFIGGYCTQLTLQGAKLSGKYGITSDFSNAASPSGTILSNVYINSAVIDATDKVINNNTENVGNGYSYGFYQIIRFYIKTGSFSEDIFTNNPDIQWRDPDVGILTEYPALTLYNGLYTIIPSIVNEDELNDALGFGGVYLLANDINISSKLTPQSDIVIMGNGKTIKAVSSMTNMFEVSSDTAGSLTFENVTLDGNSLAKHIYYNNASLASSNSDTALVIKDSTLKGCKSTGSYGAVVTKGSQSLTLENIVLNDNEAPLSSGEYRAAVFIDENAEATFKNCDFNLRNGAAVINVGTLDIKGSNNSFESTQGSAVRNSGALTIEDGEFISPDETEVIVNDGGTITVNGGTYSSELYDYVCENRFMVRSQDATSDGLYTVRDDYSGSAVVEENNDFGLDMTSYSNLQILGVQKKHAIDGVDHSQQENNDPEKSIRFITAVNEGLIRGNNIEDYGYVVGKVKDKQPLELYGTRVFDVLKYRAYNGEKTLSCKGTLNNVVTDADYGTALKSTTYKYVTLSVNNIEEGSSIAARFYVKTKNGKIYYGDYIKAATSETFKGIAASVESLQ